MVTVKEESTNCITEASIYVLGMPWQLGASRGAAISYYDCLQWGLCSALT